MTFLRSPSIAKAYAHFDANGASFELPWRSCRSTRVPPRSPSDRWSRARLSRAGLVGRDGAVRRQRAVGRDRRGSLHLGTKRTGAATNEACCAGCSPRASSPVADVVLAHVEQRERIAHGIYGRAALDAKAEPPVERHRLLVLLVHVHRGRSQLDDGVAGEAPADAGAMPRRVDEESFHLARGNADEGHESALVVANAQEVGKAEEAGKDVRLQLLEVGPGQEVVRCPDRRLPDVQDRIAFLGSDAVDAVLDGLRHSGLR